MYRDFSEQSKQNLLRLVSEVENEKYNDFTDWVGDRWLDFQSWIGLLNIRNYLNSINEYHKKMIDKNNATKESIVRIFDEVYSVDRSYNTCFSDVKTSLQLPLRYIAEMAEIVNPLNGKFTSEYISSVDYVIPTTKKGDERSETFVDEFQSNYGWKEILSGAGYIGTIYNLITDIKNGKTWKDFAKSGVKVFQFFQGAIKTWKNYRKIGNAVGTKTAMAWWARNITGFKSLGRASAAKNPFARFVNNLKNKTSPFNAQFKNVINDFKGANGVGKAVASWGAVAVNGILNWFSNKDEQADSNGTMSDARVVAETITETAVDTALTYGTGIVVGAAVTAALGTVAAPGVLVVAVSGATVAVINAGVKALTGKTTTEWISDSILDTGKAIGNAIDGAAKSVGKWFKKLSFV